MDRRIRRTLATVCATIAASAMFAATATPVAAAPVSQPATTTTTTTTTADPYCEATLTVLTQWATGYGAGFAVRNISAVPVRWQLVLKFPAPVWSVQAWNATVTQTGTVATIVPSPTTGVLAPGQSAMVGMFYASGTTPLPQAEVTCTPV
ncbi:cellulose binding domain-containing protein [Actinomycetes bacterium KLBMP 9797]